MYDGDGNRVSKTVGGVTTCYLVDDRNPSGYPQVMEEYHIAFVNYQWELLLNRVYNYGLALISQQQINTNSYLPSTLSYYGFDGHGSVRFLTGTNGSITDAYTYDAYGTLISNTFTGSQPTPNNYLYAGQQYDPDLGLYYNRARYLNPNTGRFWTMDTFAGNNEDPLSLHKYLYCHGNPVDNDDPSGHDIGEMLSVMSISGMLDAFPGLSITPMGAASVGSACGPDVTSAVMKTMRDVEQTFDAALPTTKKAAIWNLLKHPMDTMVGGWDIDKLVSLGYGREYDEEGNLLDFGNGSTFGTGMGKDTVQFSYGGPKVYRAGSVNYILWGKIFALAHSYYPHDPLFSEGSAVAAVRYNKLAGHGQIFADYADEAVAFTEFGYSGWDPSSSAMRLTPNPKNKTAPDRLKWKWLKLHDTFQ